MTAEEMAIVALDAALSLRRAGAAAPRRRRPQPARRRLDAAAAEFVAEVVDDRNPS